ncbi:MAG TPA: plastocyanin/azurin family copper-binding protein [Nitrosopumilaceae archaeon]|nr:plastocyanin/azurin family copper-binding protein [Nitrosopumilaceae archaeon]
MSHTEHEAPILRTSPARVGKMLAILIGLMVVGAVIFFANWDYWISLPPAVSKPKPVEGGPAVATGKEIQISLKFIESPDFRTLAFNALPGEAGHNPEIQANVGDKIIFDVTNGGKSFHAFGVVPTPEDVENQEEIHTPLPGTAIRDPNNPLKPGEGGQSTFVPTKAGTYYYICTVPGHRELGMEGKIVVGAVKPAGQAATPTGNKVSFNLDFLESSDFKTLAFNALPGEEGHNPDIKVKSGDSVTIHVKNIGKSFHAFGVVTNPDDPTTVVSGTTIKDPNNPIKPKEEGEVTFLAGAPGTYYYICTVPGHAQQGMKGSFIVE